MSVRTYAATALLASGSWVAVGLSTPAFAVCDAYSGGCPTVPPTDIGGETESPATGGGGDIGGETESPATGGAAGGGETGGAAGGGETGGAAGGGAAGDAAGVGETTGAAGGGEIGGSVTSPATLPFTGGELVLMTAIGAGALAGGTALVLAGRRKAAATA